MKRKFILGVFITFLTLAASSCQSLSNCESCKWVTTDSSTGQVTEAPNETEYCGADLILIKTKVVSDGNRKTVYVCH